MDIRLDGKHAMVCGASRGIGRAIAEVLAEAGASLTLVARDAGQLEAVRSGLTGEGDQHHDIMAADLSDPATLGAALGEALERQGPVDVLVNNSGGPAAGPAHEAPTAAFEAAFRQHLIANQTLVQAVLPGMRGRGGGRIINIISTSVYEPIPGLGVSNTIRGAVAAWAKTLSRELGPEGITVNNILPGFTDTDRLHSLFESRAERTGASFETVRDTALASVPLGRFADPRETAMAVCFLASDAGGYISGVSLAVDGGRLAGI
jgi:3-oxoacyl-[acyl-carrier protein] reductase